jgi:hypothetical protein
MNTKFIFTLNAIVLAVFGAGFLLVPDFVLEQFSAENYVIVGLLGRLLGLNMLLIAWFLWLLKDMANAKLSKTLAYTMFGLSVAGFAMAIYAMEGMGIVRANGWVLLVIYGLFALLYAYLLFLAPKETRHRSSSRKSKDASYQNLDTPEMH